MCIVSMFFTCLGKHECLSFCLVQVLPDRSHPKLLMSGGGGYLLSGFTVAMENLKADPSLKSNSSTLDLHETEEPAAKKRKYLESDS